MFILTQVCVSGLQLEGKHCADIASKMQRLQNHEVKGVYKYVEGLTKLLDNFFFVFKAFRMQKMTCCAT